MRRPTEAACPHYGLCFFFKVTLKSAVAIPAAPKLHRESQPPLCEPGLMGLTSRQARFVSGPQIIELGRFGEMGRTGLRTGWEGIVSGE